MVGSSLVGSSWNSAGMGHIDPKLERQQLRKEVDALMARVDKAVANKDLKAEDRIDRVEDYKRQINEKKGRLAQLKRDARAADDEKPKTPRDLAPVKAPPQGKAPKAADKAPKASKPWNPQHAELPKTKL